MSESWFVEYYTMSVNVGYPTSKCDVTGSRDDVTARARWEFGVYTGG